MEKLDQMTRIEILTGEARLQEVRQLLAKSRAILTHEIERRIQVSRDTPLDEIDLTTHRLAIRCLRSCVDAVLTAQELAV